MDIRRLQDAFDRCIDIDVCEERRWILAAQLERHPGQVGVEGRLAHCNAGRHRAGERYLAHILVVDQLLPDGAAPVDDVQRARRNAGFDSQFSNAQQ
ncbi:hypothetical protein D3C85_1756400 [compost metagenome]